MSSHIVSYISIWLGVACILGLVRAGYCGYKNIRYYGDDVYGDVLYIAFWPVLLGCLLCILLLMLFVTPFWLTSLAGRQLYLYRKNHDQEKARNQRLSDDPHTAIDGGETRLPG